MFNKNISKKIFVFLFVGLVFARPIAGFPIWLGIFKKKLKDNKIEKIFLILTRTKRVVYGFSDNFKVGTFVFKTENISGSGCYKRENLLKDDPEIFELFQKFIDNKGDGGKKEVVLIQGGAKVVGGMLFQSDLISNYKNKEKQKSKIKIVKAGDIEALYKNLEKLKSKKRILVICDNDDACDFELIKKIMDSQQFNLVYKTGIEKVDQKIVEGRNSSGVEVQYEEHKIKLTKLSEFISSFFCICNNCFKSGSKKRCASCEAVNYCSKDCQKKDWEGHKKFCKRKK